MNNSTDSDDNRDNNADDDIDDDIEDSVEQGDDSDDNADNNKGDNYNGHGGDIKMHTSYLCKYRINLKDERQVLLRVLLTMKFIILKVSLKI